MTVNTYRTIGRKLSMDDCLPHRGVADTYHITGYQVSDEGGDNDEDGICAVYAFAEYKYRERLCGVRLPYEDRIDQLALTVEDAKEWSEPTSVGVVFYDNTPVEIVAADAGRDWPVWWGREREWTRERDLYHHPDPPALSKEEI